MNITKLFEVLAAGLAIGGLGALAYGHYLGEGHELAQVRADLAAAQARLAEIKESEGRLKSETAAESAQIQRLASTKEDLVRQLEGLKSAAAAPAPSSPAPVAAEAGVVGMVRASLERHEQEQLLLLKSRLHLTPEQEAAVKAALDQEARRGEEAMAKMNSGGKLDPRAMAELKGAGVKSVDQTLNDILDPDQKAAYQQMKIDQKSSATEMVATVEMNQISTLLQLSDAQKDQVYTALYQAQANLTDPAWVKANFSGSTDPLAILNAQARAKEDALAKILNPDQLATYRQQAQSQLEAQKAMMQKFTPSPAPASPAP